ncbi:hypothetical protein GGR57DRAFT_460856 [Xylariaceae sp. FL1272]|nr:hypothetical protein GGR57DRAFT_460856 [Xylariaceae sp. FL1272]
MASSGALTMPIAHSRLPNELYIRIIELITDSRCLAHVWLNFRRVSRTFKSITESVFVKTHLRYACIDFPKVVGRVYDVDYHEYHTGLCLQFQGLDGDNNERAIFCEEPEEFRESKETRLSEEDPEKTLFKCVTDLWRNSFLDYSMPPPYTAFSTPPHIIWVRRVVDDTALPGLIVNWEEHSLSVLWKEMLTALFGEEEHREYVASQSNLKPDDEDQLRALADLANGGDNEAFEQMMQRLMSLAADADFKTRKMVRDMRIRGWYEKYTDLKPENQPDDPGKIDTMRAVENVMVFKEYDDEWEFLKSGDREDHETGYDEDDVESSEEKSEHDESDGNLDIVSE